MRLSLCEAPTRESRSDHNTGNYVPYMPFISGPIAIWNSNKGLFDLLISRQKFSH